ncbi:DinB family protein [Arthrobacter cavernae]|uniref:DinB family protein n=1 Tax=Arthrobacter cavernae TaxID=2817681 RepID=A0A939HL58_9MICC|nr:DinB family protein [Arthrobacter cavernae]MBO1269375.1 DinB family protein [Arthrobacter cavernae]
MPIMPDDKDWTWVLSRPCPECGFDATTVTPSTVPGTVTNMLPRWRQVLRREDVAVRPNGHTWSALEYACHVRDVFSLFDQRLNLMLSEEGATFADWDQDQAAIDGDYAGADARAVADQLQAEGEQIAATFAAVVEDEWQRTGTRSNGSAFTVLTFGQYFLHDVVHHLHDVDG